MIESIVKNFPSQAVSDIEKMSHDYGLRVARAIKHEWFTGVTSKYNNYINSFHNLYNLL